MDLFDEGRRTMSLQQGALLLGSFAVPEADELLGEISRLEAAAPFRDMVTPGGWPMSVTMTNCGEVGWVTDQTGYRYDPLDPETGKPWPVMPEAFRSLAERAAELAGYLGFDPDSCLMNRYEPGARVSLHQDRNERDFDAPIVSVSLGLLATFLWGGATRRTCVSISDGWYYKQRKGVGKIFRRKKEIHECIEFKKERPRRGSSK